MHLEALCNSFGLSLLQLEVVSLPHLIISLINVLANITTVPAGVVRYAAGMPLANCQKSTCYPVLRSLRYCCRTQCLKERELLPVVSFMKNILLQVPVRCEIDGRERDVSQKASAGTSVQAKYTQLPNDMDCPFWYSSVDFGRLSLNLETYFPAPHMSIHIT